MKKILLKTLVMVLPAIITLSACNNNADQGTDGADANKDSATTIKSSMNPEKYGTVDNKDVNQYTLSNAKGMTVKILNYGGIITDIMVPDKSGEMGNVVLGFDSLSGYLQKGNPYFGALVGRYANRIANARFKLDGKTYTLAANNDGNALHGGLKGFDKVIWDATQEGNTLTLNYESKDMEEGYPGNLKAQVKYTLTDDNELKIEYTATTDKPTPVNLTNHTYFNLSAGKSATIENHQLTLNADKYTPVTGKLIPTGQVAPVKGTPMDFTSSKTIGKELASVKGGYDHNYVLNKTGNELSLAATVYDSASGRMMEMRTTQPGVQFYTGNFLDGTLKGGRSGATYPMHSGFCLESQHFPDSPNQPSFPDAVLKPGQTYQETTVFKFSTK